jgi:hypothetical protein
MILLSSEVSSIASLSKLHNSSEWDSEQILGYTTMVVLVQADNLLTSIITNSSGTSYAVGLRYLRTLEKEVAKVDNSASHQQNLLTMCSPMT